MRAYATTFWFGVIILEHYKSLVPQGTPLEPKTTIFVLNPSTPIAFCK
jgi:hypothetical protein